MKPHPRRPNAHRVTPDAYLNAQDQQVWVMRCQCGQTSGEHRLGFVNEYFVVPVNG